GGGDVHLRCDADPAGRARIAVHHVRSVPDAGRHRPARRGVHPRARPLHRSAAVRRAGVAAGPAGRFAGRRMVTHGPRAHGVAGGLAALVAPVLVVPMLVGAIAVFVHVPSAKPVGAGDDSYAVELLRQSAAAGSQVSYSGTQYVSTWSALAKSAASTSAIVQVRHAAGGQTEIALHDDQTAILQGRTAASWLAGDGPVDLLLDAYDVRMAGSGTVAGRPTDIVEARRDDGSVAVRLWLDRETALSLRRESFAHDGYPLSASA